MEIFNGKQVEIPHSSHKKWGWVIWLPDDEVLWSPLAYLFKPSLSTKECKIPAYSNLCKIRYTVVLFMSLLKIDTKSTTDKALFSLSKSSNNSFTVFVFLDILIISYCNLVALVRSSQPFNYTN